MSKSEIFMSGLQTCGTFEIMQVAIENFGASEVNMFLYECLEEGRDLAYVRSELIDWIADSVSEIVEAS